MRMKNQVRQIKLHTQDRLVEVESPFEVSDLVNLAVKNTFPGSYKHINFAYFRFFIAVIARFKFDSVCLMDFSKRYCSLIW